MKSCACCGVDSEKDAFNCPICGEASWKEAKPTGAPLEDKTVKKKARS